MLTYTNESVCMRERGGAREERSIKVTLRGSQTPEPLSQSGVEVPELMPGTHTSILILLLTVSLA